MLDLSNRQSLAQTLTDNINNTAGPLDKLALLKKMFEAQLISAEEYTTAKKKNNSR